MKYIRILWFRGFGRYFLSCLCFLPDRAIGSGRTWFLSWVGSRAEFSVTWLDF